MRVVGLFFRLVLFWLAFFALGRLVGVLYQFKQVTDAGLAEIPLIFLSGLRLDLAAVSALLILPFLVWVIHALTGWKRLFGVLHGFHYILIVLLSLTYAAEQEFAREWGSKVSYRALSYLAYPREALASVESSPLVLLFTIAAGIAAFSIAAYRKIVQKTEPRPDWKLLAAVVLLGPPLLFLGVRGGWQVIGINSSSAYFSTSRINNLIAVNSGWALVESTVAARATTKNPYNYYTPEEARALSRKFYTPGQHQSILTVKRPNVVLLLLESWTADVVPSLGGEPGIAPNFEKLTEQGLLYTNFYASGARSVQGLIAVLSAFPAMSESVYDMRRMHSLPCLAQEIEKAGYSTSFLYGGDLNFAGFRSYLTFCGFDRLIGMEDFPRSLTADKWGAHDQYTLERQLEILRTAKKPFFSMLFTLSSHEPFRIPMETPFKGQNVADQFRGAVHYSDHSLADYFEKARKEPWYKDTIFVLVADHGHRLPRERLEGTPERYHIPLLIVGEPLRQDLRGAKNPRIGSQVDIVATLLAELGLSSGPFHWSKDLEARPGSSFAYYAYEGGFGLVSESSTVIYHEPTGRWVISGPGGVTMASKSGDATDAVKPGQAIMQTIFQDYLELR